MKEEASTKHRRATTKKGNAKVIGSPSSAGARADTAFGAFWTGGQTLLTLIKYPDAGQIRLPPSDERRRPTSERKKKDERSSSREKREEEGRIVCDGKIVYLSINTYSARTDCSRKKTEQVS